MCWVTTLSSFPGSTCVSIYWAFLKEKKRGGGGGGEIFPSPNELLRQPACFASLCKEKFRYKLKHFYTALHIPMHLWSEAVIRCFWIHPRINFFLISSKRVQAYSNLLESSVVMVLMNTLALIYKTCKAVLHLKHLHQALQGTRFTQAK